MKKLLKYVGYIVLSGLAVVSLYLVNLFLMKPYSIDHYLAKELTVSLLDSPEFCPHLWRVFSHKTGEQWCFTGHRIERKIGRASCRERV